MKNSSDPAIHRQREQQLLAHVQKLLTDDRFRVPTAAGMKPVTGLIRQVTSGDQAIELKRKMAEVGVFDRSLQNQMPLGQSLDVSLSQKGFFGTKAVGQLRLVSVSPVEALLKKIAPRPLDVPAAQKVLSAVPPSLGGPQTVLLLSTSGFTPDALTLAADKGGRAVVLVEPTDAGGWSVATPPGELQSLVALLNPETDDQKRQRIRDAIGSDQGKLELLTGGLSVERIAERQGVPVSLVEEEFRAYAAAHSGLVAKRVDGRFVLFRAGSAASLTGADTTTGGSMGLFDRVKALFGSKGDDEKKVSFLSERIAALSLQRDTAYEEISVLEKQEEGLRTQFKDASGTLTKKRITTQLLQLRKDLERRQQLVSVLNQQINVVSTHRHSLELVKQGQSAQLPDTEEMTADAVKAEEVLAELQASTELATSMGSASVSMSSEEEALFAELEAEAKGEREKAEKQKKEASPGDELPELEVVEEPPEPARPPPIPERRRSGPQAG